MGDTKLVLLADRDDDTRARYSEFLRQLTTYEVDEADDGREALARAFSRQPSVIVTETRLPGMSGIELCRQLRLNPSTNAIAIIVVAAAGESDVRVAEAAGADAVLFKPCLPDTLGAEIGRLLAALRWPPAAWRFKRAPAAPGTSSQAVAAPRRGRRMLSRTHDRSETRHPQTVPPALVCPVCDGWLRYLKSQLGGVSERFAEQWDYFECPRGCGGFEYRQRTRKIRALTTAMPAPW